ncbi:DUF1275 domain-containing protein [Rhizobium sp. 16-449-1b]|uniref:YoaK family protein n=1 Tax=Rhizobium sp. 16-449-1b TaxID=2819989 RepID=UPI001ADA2785|nr:YoaK family protein [Rhizobium sp. 16-449-1b]MBO9195962.1 DUF1275 domain-containing protein [Rhizobium sp. 16-449-1b]
MLISQGAARNERINLNLACSLAMIAGALNAAAFYAVGFFSANMTGNVSSLSDHLATAHWGQAVFFFTVIIIFILGAAISSLLINSGRRRGIAAIYAYSILLEAILLAVLGIADIWFLAMWRPPLLTLGLAFLMGLQNATVTRISDARVRTTHVSGMATDVGIELGIALDILRGREPDTYAVENRTRLTLHIWTIGAFLVGGVFAYQHVGIFVRNFTQRDQTEAQAVCHQRHKANSLAPPKLPLIAA